MTFSSAGFYTFTILAFICTQLTELVQASTATVTVTACSNGHQFNYGACSNVNITYTYDSSSGTSWYTPADQNKFDINPSTDLASVESGICSTLGSNTCNASATAVLLCLEVFWMHSGLTGSQGVQIWNDMIAQGSDCSATSTKTVTSYVLASSSSSVTVSTSSVDATTTILVNTHLTTTILTSTVQATTSTLTATVVATRSSSSNRNSVSTASSTTTTQGTSTSTSDTTSTQTITSLTTASSQSKSTTTSSDPFSMNGTPFIDNAGANISTNFILLTFAVAASIMFSSLVMVLT